MGPLKASELRSHPAELIQARYLLLYASTKIV